MGQVIIRPNAVPVYGFLSYINARAEVGGRILDCGAGGAVPPLALFAQHGFESWGIDISETQLEKGQEFCQETGLEIDLRQGDMRAMPFEDRFFDFVYEQYAMCHLSKEDTLKAVTEMHRVLKPGGFCFLGVISIDTWPRSMFGEEEDPGEYWGEEGGRRTRHSLFTDAEADQLVADWEVLKKEKLVTYIQSSDQKASLNEWMERFQQTKTGPTQEEWEGMYGDHADKFAYHHLYYTLKKN